MEVKTIGDEEAVDMLSALKAHVPGPAKSTLRENNQETCSAVSTHTRAARHGQDT